MGNVFTQVCCQTKKKYVILHQQRIIKQELKNINKK